MKNLLRKILLTQIVLGTILFLEFLTARKSTLQISRLSFSFYWGRYAMKQIAMTAVIAIVAVGLFKKFAPDAIKSPLGL